MEQTIRDPEKKLEYLLQNHNIKKCDFEKEIPLQKEKNQQELIDIFFKRKSYRTFQNASTPIAELDEICKMSFSPEMHFSLNYEQKKISKKDLKEILFNFSSVQLKNLKRPKFLYPSGGSSYTVQIYLEIPINYFEEIEGGYYYFDPL